MSQYTYTCVCVSVCLRPLERTVTLHKDLNGQLGFLFKKGRITAIVKDSSAARNGLLTDQQICEINGQNVIGLKVSVSLFLFLSFSVSEYHIVSVCCLLHVISSPLSCRTLRSLTS